MDRQGDAERLTKLYAQRVPEGMSQEQFGKRFGIGNQSMVSQYLSGHRPLNFEAAAKFAKGLRCTIADISPELTRRLRVDIIPVLGRISARIALAIMLALPPFLPSKVEAAFNITFNTIHIAWRWLGSCFAKLCALRHILTKFLIAIS